MNSSPLIGQRVRIGANSFVQTDLAAHIVFASKHDQALLLKLDAPLTVAGVTYTHVIASPRLARDDLNALLNNKIIGCAVTWVPRNRFDQNKPFDLNWWRGGAAVVTDVMLNNRGQTTVFR